MSVSNKMNLDCASFQLEKLLRELEIAHDEDSSSADEEDFFEAVEEVSDVINEGKVSLNSKCGEVWNSSPRRAIKRVENIIRRLSQPTFAIRDEIDCFKHFMDIEIIYIIVEFTNQQGRLSSEKALAEGETSSWMDANRVERTCSTSYGSHAILNISMQTIFSN